MAIENEVSHSEPVDFEKLQAARMLDEAIPDDAEDGNLNAPEIEAEKPRADATESLYGALSIVPIGFTHFGYKNAAKVWADDKCRALAGALVPVFRKYAWGGRIIDFLETGAGVEEVALGMILMPMALSTYHAVNADNESFAAEELKREDEEPQVYGTNRP